MFFFSVSRVYIYYNITYVNTCQARFILRRYSMQLFIYCVLFVWNAFDTQSVSAILIHVLPTKACQEKKLRKLL